MGKRAGVRKPLILVVAGNHREFNQWVHYQNLSVDDCVYVSQVKGTRGRRLDVPGDRVVFVGTWEEREDKGEIESALVMMMDREHWEYYP